MKPSTDETTPATTSDAPRRGRPKGSKNKVQKKLTNASLAYLVEKYGVDTVVPVSTAWLEEQARALVAAQIAEAAASASAVEPTEDSSDTEEVEEASETPKVSVNKTDI